MTAMAFFGALEISLAYAPVALVLPKLRGFPWFDLGRAGNGKRFS